MIDLAIEQFDHQIDPSLLGHPRHPVEPFGTNLKASRITQASTIATKTDQIGDMPLFGQADLFSEFALDPLVVGLAIQPFGDRLMPTNSTDREAMITDERPILSGSQIDRLIAKLGNAADECCGGHKAWDKTPPRHGMLDWHTNSLVLFSRGHASRIWPSWTISRRSA
ncbi:MAG: hypothetical protein OHK0050_10550 [Roseiflexaceae bacterium]